MKIFLTVIIFLITVLPGFSQKAYIGDKLFSKLHNLKNNQDKFKVIIVLKDQVDFEELQNDFNKNNVSLATRQKTVYSELRKNAEITSRPVIDYINSYNKKNMNSVYEIETFWIINAIVAEIPAGLIWDLSERDDISWIELNDAIMTLPVTPVKTKPVNNKEIDCAEQGLKAINAPFMWRKGYTGKNRISLSIDTGVWPEHNAISDSWLGNYFPLSQCWYPYDYLIPADKTGAHGTHTVGTTLGLDPATNDTIGAAFNAYFICSDPVATSMATVKPLSDFMYAYQFALNPDGDTSTTWDIPDVINNSWGYGIATDTSLCDSYVSQMFLAIEAAGIANVFSAGNDGPGTQTIGSPHHLNSNIVNSFTVGALDANLPSFPIASFSSRGPSICGGTGSLLIKPEVSAPGVDVRSCIQNQQYYYYSGTSMAAPHVTGAVLLLKEAFPTLPGNEILLALYYTATDLGDPGEDNTYGMGMINLESAFNFLDSIYTATLPDSNAYDAQINSQGYSLVCDSSISCEITLKNNSDSILSSGVFYYKANNYSEYTYNWAGNLAKGESENITLPEYKLSEGGNYEMIFRFESDSSFSETSLINNNSTARFNFRPSAQLPYIEDFENGIDNKKWMICNPDQNTTWDTTHADGIQFSKISAIMSFSTELLNYQKDELITPVLDLSNYDSVKLCFDVAYQNIHPVRSDTLNIYISTDCGNTYNSKVYHKGGNELSTYDTITSDFHPWKESQWRKEYVDLSAFTGSSKVLVKFSGVNKKGNNLFIDNIKIYSGNEPEGFISEKTNTWKIFPNPADNILTIVTNFPSSPINVKVFDITGKCLLETKGRTNTSCEYNIDIQILTNGIYIIQAYINNFSFITKFIKSE